MCLYSNVWQLGPISPVLCVRFSLWEPRNVHYKIENLPHSQIVRSKRKCLFLWILLIQSSRQIHFLGKLITVVTETSWIDFLLWNGHMQPSISFVCACTVCSWVCRCPALLVLQQFVFNWQLFNCTPPKKNPPSQHSTSAYTHSF